MERPIISQVLIEADWRVVVVGVDYCRAVCVKVRMTMCGVERERSLVAEVLPCARASSHSPGFPKLKVAFTARIRPRHRNTSN